MGKKIFFKKLICLFVVIFSAFTSVLFIGCNKKTEFPDRSDVKLLFLGDSIAEAVAGPSPISERDSYAYASIVGVINGYTFRNRAISGDRTEQLLEYISTDRDDNAYAVYTHLRTADIISISILGNDLLAGNFNSYLRDAVDGDFYDVDDILEESYTNLIAVLDLIRTFNDKAVIIMQTVYNPVYSDSPMLSDYSKSYLANRGITKERYREKAQLIMDRLNNVLTRLQEAKPGEFHLIDVAAKFDEMSGGDDQLLKRYIYSDGVHPSNEGHAHISSLLQEKLIELGLTDKNSSLARYKVLVSDRLERLYGDTAVSVNDVKKKINGATSFDEINKEYFNATYNVVPKYE